MNPEVFIDTGREIHPGDIVICHAPRSTPALYRTKDDIRVYWIHGRILDYHPSCLPDGTIVMYLSTEMVAGYTWAKILYKDSTFIPDDDGDFCSDIIPAQEIVLVVDCKSQYIGPSGLEVITILFGEQTYLVCPDCLVEM